MTDLQRAISRAEDWAGTMPAKQAVKLRPSDWHDVVRLGRAVAKQLETAQKVDEQQTDDFIKDKAEIARLRKALEAARDDFELIEQRIDEGQARRAGETAHQGWKEALLALEVEVEARKAIGPVDAYVGIPDNG